MAFPHPTFFPIVKVLWESPYGSPFRMRRVIVAVKSLACALPVIGKRLSRNPDVRKGMVSQEQTKFSGHARRVPHDGKAHHDVAKLLNSDFSQVLVEIEGLAQRLCDALLAPLARCNPPMPGSLSHGQTLWLCTMRLHSSSGAGQELPVLPRQSGVGAAPDRLSDFPVPAPKKPSPLCERLLLLSHEGA